jgi:hypothetical protein
MDTINLLADEDDLIDSFVHTQAIKLFTFVQENSDISNDYVDKLCYWLCSNLEPNYAGTFSVISEYNKWWKETENLVMITVLDILKLCGGNLLNPEKKDLLVRNNLEFSDDKFIGEGAFGKVYLIDERAVKVSPFSGLSVLVKSLLKETTALSILNRLIFIGLNADSYYIGMKYLPHEVPYSYLETTKNQLIKELKHIHSCGIIHRDVTLFNARLDQEGKVRLFDFGQCMFTSEVNTIPYIGADVYRDCLSITIKKLSTKNKKCVDSFEIDIWFLGMIFDHLLTANRRQ